jgi:hypothetical protein
MSEKISFQDANGTEVSGRFEVSHGMITVTAPDGRTKTAEIEEGTLSPETFAKMLLFLLHHGTTGRLMPGALRPTSPNCRSCCDGRTRHRHRLPNLIDRRFGRSRYFFADNLL